MKLKLNRYYLVLSAFLALLCLVCDVSAEPSGKLQLTDVLRAVDESHPQIEAIQETIKAADSNKLAARGAWDPKLKVSSQWLTQGYYTNRQLDTTIRQATPLWGLGLYAGYRQGRGEYATYKRDLETLSDGEIRFGVEAPLWKNGPIDERRLGIQRSDMIAEAVRCAEQGLRLQLNKKAALAYWRWVANGQEVGIQRELLRVAELRDGGLREQFRLGSIPQITIIDNERLVLDRRSKLVSAELDFEEASTNISLFYRDQGLQPIRPILSTVIAEIPFVPLSLRQAQSDIDQALKNRPEVCEMELALQLAEAELKFKKNQRAPDLRARAFVARDYGEGAEDLVGTDVGLGVSLEVPLFMRKERGEYQAAKAKKREVKAKQRTLLDSIRAEVQQARFDLNAAIKQVEVAERQFRAANKLAQAERDKLNLGSSNLVLVNLREISAADSARLKVEAKTSYQQSMARYRTALGENL